MSTKVRFPARSLQCMSSLAKGKGGEMKVYAKISSKEISFLGERKSVSCLVTSKATSSKDLGYFIVPIEDFSFVLDIITDAISEDLVLVWDGKGCSMVTAGKLTTMVTSIRHGSPSDEARRAFEGLLGDNAGEPARATAKKPKAAPPEDPPKAVQAKSVTTTPSGRRLKGPSGKLVRLLDGNALKIAALRNGIRFTARKQQESLMRDVAKLSMNKVLEVLPWEHLAKAAESAGVRAPGTAEECISILKQIAQ